MYKLNKINGMATNTKRNRNTKRKEFLTGGSVGNRPAISGLHPTAHERHGHEQRSAIALKLLFGYLNCRPSNIVVEEYRRGGVQKGWRFSTRYQRGAIVEKIQILFVSNGNNLIFFNDVRAIIIENNWPPFSYAVFSDTQINRQDIITDKQQTHIFEMCNKFVESGLKVL